MALACAHRWHRRRDTSIRWAILTFGSLAVIGIIGLALRSSPTAQYAVWFVKTVLVVLVLFPYFLYRFATAFERLRGSSRSPLMRRRPAWCRPVALPYLPIPGTRAPAWWSALRFGTLVQWTILFSIVAARLWLASRHEASSSAAACAPWPLPPAA